MRCFACTDVIGLRSNWHFVGALRWPLVGKFEVVQHKYLNRRWQLDQSRASPSAMAGHFGPRRAFASGRVVAGRHP
jgi:hypothetical protein